MKTSVIYSLSINNRKKLQLYNHDENISEKKEIFSCHTLHVVESSLLFDKLFFSEKKNCFNHTYG